LTERRQEFLASLAKGRYVFVPRYKKRCLVTKVDRGRGEISVRLGKPHRAGGVRRGDGVRRVVTLASRAVSWPAMQAGAW
jgi:hypothetical protein